MRKALGRNWFPKIVCLLLATAIWFLIRNYLDELDRERMGRDGRRDRDGRGFVSPFETSPSERRSENPKTPPKAIPIDE